MGHASLLKLLLPPVSYEPSGLHLSAELAAEGARLDQALTSAGIVLQALSPAGGGGLFLAEWERVLGLPDECAGGLGQTVTERIAAAVAKVRARGGQDRAYFADVAQGLGYAVAIEEYEVFTCDSPCDDPICDEDWRYAWTARAQETTIREFGCDTPCDEPLRTWGNRLLECVLSRLKPAHTHLLFAYGG